MAALEILREGGGKVFGPTGLCGDDEEEEDSPEVIGVKLKTPISPADVWAAALRRTLSFSVYS